MRARRVGLALAASLALAACTHEDAAPWTPALDPPAISASTLSVLFTTGGAMVWERLDPISGESRRLLVVPRGDPSTSEVVWSPDGRHAALAASTGSAGNALFEIDLTSGATREIPALAGGARFDQLFFRDDVLYGWTQLFGEDAVVNPNGGARRVGTPHATSWRLEGAGWRRCTAPPPDDAAVASLDDYGLHYSTLDVRDDEISTGTGVIAMGVSPLRHHRGRFTLVSSDEEPQGTLLDENGRLLWKTPASGYAVWWPGPIAAPQPTPTPDLPRRKYYVEPDE